jgi:hypothetical protein
MSLSKIKNIYRKLNTAFDELIGQVTGASGTRLKQLADFINGLSIKLRQTENISITEIANQGINDSQVGKVILFTPKN